MASTPTDVRFFPEQSSGSKSIPIYRGSGSRAALEQHNKLHMEQAMAQEAAEYRDMVMFKRIYSMRQESGSQHHSASCLVEEARVIRYNHGGAGESPPLSQPHHRRTWSAPASQESLWRSSTSSSEPTTTAARQEEAEKESLPPRAPTTHYVNVGGTAARMMLPPKSSSALAVSLVDHARLAQQQQLQREFSWPQPSSLDTTTTTDTEGVFELEL